MRFRRYSLLTPCSLLPLAAHMQNTILAKRSEQLIYSHISWQQLATSSIMTHLQRPTPTVMERTGSLRSLLLERKDSFRSLPVLSERTTDSLRKESLKSLISEGTDSLRFLAAPIVEGAMSVRKLLSVPYKSVTFGDGIHDRVHRILSRDDYSNEELDAAFYWREDYNCMRKKRRNAENLLQRRAQDETEEANEEDDEDTDCVYGLETKAEAGARSSLITKSVVAVLVEQDMQWNNDQRTADPIILATIYSHFSVSSSEAAHERALKLELSMRGYIAPCRWSPAFRKTSRKPERQWKPEKRQSSMAHVCEANVRPITLSSAHSTRKRIVIPMESAQQATHPRIWKPERQNSWKIWKPERKSSLTPVCEANVRPITLSIIVPMESAQQATHSKKRIEKLETRASTPDVVCEANVRPIILSISPVQPVRESSFRWRAPKLPIRNKISKSWKPEHQRPTIAKQKSASLPSAAAPIQPVRESSFRWRAPKLPIRKHR